MGKFTPTICFDFDGVIHSYRSGWKGEANIPDPPVMGMKDLIKELRKKYKIVVMSSRASNAEGIDAIRKWLSEYDIIVDDITNIKVPALLYIDDRAIGFNGNCEDLLHDIVNFKHWHKRNGGA